MTSNGFSPNRIDTLIGANTRIDGDVDYSGVMRIQGEVKGNVVCREAADGGLVVDSAGGVTGTVKAPHIVVKGRFAGPVDSSRTIEVHQGASLTGDIAFRHLIIHAGGVVDGALTPTLDDAQPGADLACPAPGAGATTAQTVPGKHKLGIAAAAAVAVIFVIWAGSRFSTEAPPPQDAAPAAASPGRSASAEPAPASREERASESAAAEPPAPALAPAATLASPASDEETVVVRGANPNRPAGVFLLVAHEPAVLYRKHRGDAGGGTRLAADAGEKVSISVDRSELVRVAKGRTLEIYFQGQKVPRDLVERGVWISFVPTNGSPLP